ncbi:MAG: aldehyde dehydrogenase family protein [Archangium sp.]
MTFRITYSVLDADMEQLHKEFDGALNSLKLGREFGGRLGGASFTNRNPSRPDQTLATYKTATSADIDAAVKSAKKAYEKWRKTPWGERAAIIRKAADNISARRLELAAWLTLEVGKNRLESLGDVEESADLLRYYAGQLEQSHGFSQPLGKLSPNEDTRDVLRPYGVFAVIAPFNFPMALGTGMAGAALLAGNTVVLKPSDSAPFSGEALFEVLRDAGLPEGVFTVIHGDGIVGEALSKHPEVDGIAFTGGSAVGKQLQHTMLTGRSYPRPCLMELGGKNGTLVTSSADIDAAVEGCARSAFGLSGQKCSALSRIFVAKDRHDEFLRKLIDRTASIKVGDPALRETYMGPVINAKSVVRFEAAAKSAPTIHFGGKVRGGNFVDPTIVSAPKGHALTRDELFLPFIVVDSFSTFEEGMQRLNEVDYGLTAGIFSTDENELSTYFDEAQAGVLYANRKTGATTGAWPGVQSFCGWKASGSTGRGGCGPFYVAQFAREQSRTRML